MPGNMERFTAKDRRQKGNLNERPTWKKIFPAKIYGLLIKR